MMILGPGRTDIGREATRRGRSRLGMPVSGQERRILRDLPGGTGHAVLPQAPQALARWVAHRRRRPASTGGCGGTATLGDPWLSLMHLCGGQPPKRRRRLVGVIGSAGWLAHAPTDRYRRPPS